MCLTPTVLLSMDPTPIPYNLAKKSIVGSIRPVR